MGTHQKSKLFARRSSLPPTWAVNVTEMKVLLARYFEKRAAIVYPRGGSPEERLDFAQKKILTMLPKKEERLTARCREYVEIKKSNGDSARLRALQLEIQGLDAEMLMARRGPAVVVAIIYFYFRCGFDSVATAAEVGLKPQGVRQIVHHLHRTWTDIKNDTDRRPPPPNPKPKTPRPKTPRPPRTPRPPMFSAEERLARKRKYTREWTRKWRARMRAAKQNSAPLQK